MYFQTGDFTQTDNTINKTKEDKKSTSYFLFCCLEREMLQDFSTKNKKMFISCSIDIAKCSTENTKISLE